jgi:hypothetical protein
MQLILTTEEELNAYISFLYEASISCLPITLTNEESEAYIQGSLMKIEVSEDNSEEALVGYKANKLWELDELLMLPTFILQGTPPKDISKALGRSESGVRSKVRSILNMAYQSNKWVDIIFNPNDR